MPKMTVSDARRVLGTILLTLTAALASASPKGDKVMTHQPLFYRGEMDERVTTAENGARVNADYLAFVTEGPWAEVKTWEVGSRIHTITGYGMANHTFIEGDTGLIMVDTGQNIGAGLEALKMKQAFSDKPIVAIIYTHFHYTRGTRGIVESYPDSDIPIFGHPEVDQNLQEMLSYLAPGRLSRGARQFGHHLPSEGPDAEYSIMEPQFEDASLNAGGHMPVSHPVADGEQIDIDGLGFIFHHAVADTEDSLIIHIPELDAVVHNAAVMPFMFPMYTLRGDWYRSPPEVIDAVDRLRSLNPEYLIGCHGNPVIGREEVYRIATAHRDALALIYQQTVRGINQDLSPDEIAHRIQLPPALSDVPELFSAYVDVEHMVRGVYRGLIGWWAIDGADLHPPSADELGSEIVQGFGGVEPMLRRVNAAIDEGRYNLAAKLASYAVAAEPNNLQARQAKANALRKMAYATPTGIQTRNFLLTEALQLEGKVQTDAAVGLGIPGLSVEALLALPPGPFLEALAYTIDPVKAADLVATVKIELSDIDQSYTLAVRHGAVEYVAAAPATHDLELSLERKAWAQIVAGDKDLEQLVADGGASFKGDNELKQTFLAAYADVL